MARPGALRCRHRLLPSVAHSRIMRALPRAQICSTWRARPMTSLCPVGLPVWVLPREPCPRRRAAGLGARSTAVSGTVRQRRRQRRDNLSLSLRCRTESSSLRKALFLWSKCRLPDLVRKMTGTRAAADGDSSRRCRWARCERTSLLCLRARPCTSRKHRTSTRRTPLDRLPRSKWLLSLCWMSASLRLAHCCRRMSRPRSSGPSRRVSLASTRTIF